MARTRRSHGFTALRIEGGILPPEFLQNIAALEAPRQTGADYGLSKSLALKEELARYWRIANDLYTRYSERCARQDLIARQVGVDEWLVPLLRSLLGYDDLTTSNSVTLGDQVFKLTHHACGEAVPLLLVTRDFNLDKADPRFGYEGRRQAPHGLMQEYLNAEDGSLWGIVSNGSKLRILRDNPSLTRPSYIEADLDLVFTEELYPDFAALWLAGHASRLKPLDGKPSSCIIETWRANAHETGERALENLRDGVTEALRQIGNGFLQHADNDELRAKLEDGTLSREHYFQQLLGLVYRLLFLFAAESAICYIPRMPRATSEPCLQTGIRFPACASVRYVDGITITIGTSGRAFRLRSAPSLKEHRLLVYRLWVGCSVPGSAPISTAQPFRTSGSWMPCGASVSSAPTKHLPALTTGTWVPKSSAPSTKVCWSFSRQWT